MMRIAILTGAIATLLGCATQVEDSPEATLEKLCARPGAYADESVRVAGPVTVDTSLGECTAAGCDRDASCCNACLYPFALECPAGSPFTHIRVGGTTELGTPVVDAVDWSTVSLPRNDIATNFGCVGNECEVGECSPADPAELVVLEGTVTLIGVSGEPRLQVTSFERQETE